MLTIPDPSTSKSNGYISFEADAHGSISHGEYILFPGSWQEWQKLDDPNSAVTIMRGIVGNQGQDIREIRNQVKIVDVHLDGIDTRLDGLKEEISVNIDIQGSAVLYLGSKEYYISYCTINSFTTILALSTSKLGTANIGRSITPIY